MTLKAKELIEQADCIVYDRLVGREILDFARQDAELIYVGKENHRHVMKQEAINALLLRKAAEHQLVVRLKGGDPYVFGRGGEEALYLKEHQVEVEVIPGVTSAISVLSAAGIPITHRNVAKGFQVVTAHSKNDQPSDIDFSKLMDESITYVFLMGLSHVEWIAKSLIEAGRSEDTGAAVISNGTTARQKKCIGTLENIGRLVQEAGLESPAIIVVGDVVGLSDELSFFEKKPLFGKRVIVPYIRGFGFDYCNGIEQVPESNLIISLRENGADVIGVQVGKIIPVVHRMSTDYLKSFQWILFTSSNGVNSFMYNLKLSGLDARSLGETRIGVVGKKTAKTLESFSLGADYISRGQNAESMALEMGEILSGMQNVLYVSAADNSGELEEILAGKCNLTVESFYENAECDFEKIEDVADYICFTSASTVKRTLADNEIKSGTKIITIGSSTSKAVLGCGHGEYIQAREPSYEGILEMVLDDIKKV